MGSSQNRKTTKLIALEPKTYKRIARIRINKDLGRFEDTLDYILNIYDKKK